MKQVGLLLSVFLMVSGVVQAQTATSPPKISVSANPLPLIAGEPFSLEISIETEGTDKPNIQLPRLGGFRIIRQYESHPSSFSFSFGFGSGATNIRKEQANYTFVLIADKPGDYTLDPVIVTLGEQRYKGNPYKLKVMKGSQASGGAVQQDDLQDEDNVQAVDNIDEAAVETLEGAKVDPEYFVQTAVSKKEAYVGEMLTMTIYLYMAQHISGYDIIREPGTEGFWGENLIPSTRRNLSVETVSVNGRRYDRAALRQLALFPIKSGTLTISPTVVEIESGFGGFFSRPKSYKRSSLPVEIKVMELPSDGQPSDFNPSDVGEYKFEAKLDRLEVKTGEPVTLTLSVSGEGNLRNLSLPKMPEIEGLKTYAPETEVSVEPKGTTVTGIRTSRILIIPEKAGQFDIPAFTWSYFSPKEGKYRTVSSKTMTLLVTGRATSVSDSSASVQEVSTVSRAGQDRLNSRLRSIGSRGDLKRKTDGGMLTRIWFLSVAFGVPLIYLGALGVLRTRRNLEISKKKNISKHADAEALRKIAELKKKQNDATAEVFFGELQRCLITFLERRLEEKIVGDTINELRERLVSRGISFELAESTISENEACDFARFAKQSSDNSERERMLAQMEKLIRELAKVQLTPKKKEDL